AGARAKERREAGRPVGRRAAILVGPARQKEANRALVHHIDALGGRALALAIHGLDLALALDLVRVEPAGQEQAEEPRAVEIIVPGVERRQAAELAAARQLDDVGR